MNELQRRRQLGGLSKPELITKVIEVEREMHAREWRLNLNDDNTVDELVMSGAHVHLEDLGNAYMLIVENHDQHVHLTIPAHTRRKAFVYEQYTPEEP